MKQDIVSTRKPFLTAEVGAGLVLLASAVLALVVANSRFGEAYAHVLHLEAGGLSVQHWINDGLMAVFFLLVGLEIKREIVSGKLSDWPSRVLPGLAAIGGMLVPAVIFAFLNRSDPVALRGWAIPTATDIAFALGVLALLGSRVPVSLKIFLTALAILDDLGAILVIAVFYTSELSLGWLAAAAALFGLALIVNRRGPYRLAPFMIIGLVMWFAFLKSGVHATLAGVILAMAIPMGAPGPSGLKGAPLLHRLEHALQPVVSFAILPLFGFANAGVSLSGFSVEALFNPVTLGVAAGLFVGKQAGVFLFVWGSVRAGLARLPEHASWLQVYGVATLCGVGFTMSLFIGLLAFPGAADMQEIMKIGVLSGSLLSGVAGALVLLFAGRRRASVPDQGTYR